jgi:hypothetical protein
VKFANTNPRMIAFYCAWLRRFFEIDEARLRVRLYLNEGLDLAASVAFWSENDRHPAVAVPEARTGRFLTRRSGAPSMCMVA